MLTALRLGLVLVLAWPMHGWAKGAESSYRKAETARQALRADSSRRQFRHEWLNVADKYEGVASRYPKSRRTPEALYAAAELRRELSRISLMDEDVQAALADYRKLYEGHPRHRLAGDAALAAAKIYSERLGKPALARKVIAQALALRPGASASKALKAYGAQISSDENVSDGAVKKAVSLAPDEAEPARSSLRAGRGSPHVLRTEVVRRLQSVESNRDDVTLAEQLGLKVRRVIIDAGHGGRDSGALGHRGTAEKTVALSIAKRLRDILAQSGLEVVLTREDDTFVRLEDRTKMANAAKGDLFISIHCNSAKSRALSGIETYTLNTASDRYSIRLAARENSASVRGISDLQFILTDLATKANTDESSRLAAQVQRSLVTHLGAKYRNVRDLGTKEALFYVLLGARMPAILVETSFLSNPEDERRLSSRSYQGEVASAIASGVREFLENRQRLAKSD